MHYFLWTSKFREIEIDFTSFLVTILFRLVAHDGIGRNLLRDKILFEQKICMDEYQFCDHYSFGHPSCKKKFKSYEIYLGKKFVKLIIYLISRVFTFWHFLVLWISKHFFGFNLKKNYLKSLLLWNPPPLWGPPPFL